jgi:translation initiation factor IF-1
MSATAEMAIEARLTRARVLRHVYEGTPDDVAAEDLGIALDEFRALRAEAISDEGRRIVKLKPEEVYAEYLFEMRRIIRGLMRIRRASVRNGVFGPAVQALKTAGELLDKSLARGQELGVLVSAAQPTKHLHAHVVAHLDNPSLRAMIVSEVERMGRLLGSESDLLDISPEDIVDAEIVRDDAAPKEGEGEPEKPPRTGRPAFARGGPGKARGGRAVHRKKRDIDDILGD